MDYTTDLEQLDRCADQQDCAAMNAQGWEVLYLDDGPYPYCYREVSK